MEKMYDEYADVFTCVKCRNPRVAKIARVVKDYVIVTGKCLKGHSFKLKLPLIDEHKWMGYLENSIFKCKCGMPLSEHKVKEGRKKTTLILKCPTHKQTRTVDTILWNTIKADRETQETLRHPKPYKPAPEPEQEKETIKIEKKNPHKPQKWQVK
ncbi:MAG: hypothetical protein ACTSSA_04950 [Candidatus Freyarchaeota archaeon]